MPISVLSLGVNNNSSGATVAVTTGAATATGDTIVVGILDRSNAAVGGSLTDSAGNTYTPINGVSINNTQANGFVRLWYCQNASPLSAGGTITYTKAVSGQRAYIIALRLRGGKTTGILDSVVSASAFGSSTSPSVTSGTPSDDEGVFIGLTGYSAASSYTEDTTNGWSAVDNTASAENLRLSKQDYSALAAETYNPTIGSSTTWASLVTGFLAASADLSIATTEAADVGAFSAGITASSSAPVVEGADVGAFSTGIVATAGITQTEIADTASITTEIKATLDAPIAEATDAVVVAVNLPDFSLVTTEATDTLAASMGIVATSEIAISEAVDVLAGQSLVFWPAVFDLTETPDGYTGVLFVADFFSGAASEIVVPWERKNVQVPAERRLMTAPAVADPRQRQEYRDMSTEPRRRLN